MFHHKNSNTHYHQHVVVGSIGKRMVYVHWSPDDLLDFFRFQESGQVSSGHDGLWQIVVALELRLLSPGSVEGVQTLEGWLGPDDEATHVTTGCQLQQVQLVDADQGDTGNVAESLGQSLVFSVHNQWAQFGGATAIAHLAFTGAESSRLVDLDKKFQKTWRYRNFTTIKLFCQTPHPLLSRQGVWTDFSAYV